MPKICELRPQKKSVLFAVVHMVISVIIVPSPVVSTVFVSMVVTSDWVISVGGSVLDSSMGFLTMSQASIPSTGEATRSVTREGVARDDRPNSRIR